MVQEHRNPSRRCAHSVRYNVRLHVLVVVSGALARGTAPGIITRAAVWWSWGGLNAPAEIGDKAITVAEISTWYALFTGKMRAPDGGVGTPGSAVSARQCAQNTRWSPQRLPPATARHRHRKRQRHSACVYGALHRPTAECRTTPA